MYGILLQSVRLSIIAKYGESAWSQIEQFIGIESDSILAKKIYPDSLFDQIIKGLMMLHQAGDSEIYMEQFGKSFVGHITTFGYDKILRMSGRCFRDFLHSIDQLHESNRFSFPQMKHPLFYVDKEDADGLYLHYQSKRRGFNSYVIGQLKECAKKFFKKEIRVKIYKDVSDKEFNHVIFRVEFDNSDYINSLKNNLTPLRKKQDIGSVPVERLLSVLSCCLAIDKTLKITFASDMFQNLFGSSICGRSFCDSFKIIRPKSVKDWTELICLSYSLIFELTNIIELNPTTRGHAPPLKIVFKGQIKLIKELDVALFIGHPVINNMEDMPQIGLYLNDLNNFDSSAEILVTEMQKNFELSKAFSHQQVWTTQLERTKNSLRAWRKKSRKLLHTMLPTRIACRIEAGAEPNSICEVFDNVTIMFVTAIDFEKIMNAADPAKIAGFIDETFSVYDRIVEQYEKVCKIETKADGSYMIVTGIDTQEEDAADGQDKKEAEIKKGLEAKSRRLSLTDLDEQEAWMMSVEKKVYPVDYNQAELLAAVGLEIIESLSESEISIRIGFHSGSVVGGIVGISRFQFCLFGDAVNVASRMCGMSESGRMCCSEASYEMLRESKYFNVEAREKMHVKGKGEVNSYWVNARPETD